MRKEFLVYQNKVYSNFVNYINGYILLSKDQRYSVYDSVLYKGQEFAMAGHKRGDDDFTAPDSYVRLLVFDKEFLIENNLADDAELLDEKYGQTMYASGKIPVSEVTILRRRKDLPVDRRRKI